VSNASGCNLPYRYKFLTSQAAAVVLVAVVLKVPAALAALERSDAVVEDWVWSSCIRVADWYSQARYWYSPEANWCSQAVWTAESAGWVGSVEPAVAAGWVGAVQRAASA